MSYQAVLPISGILCVRVCIHSRKSGKCEQWMNQADPHVKKVSETVCGPLLQELCERTSYWDKCCVEVFRLGTSLWYTLLHLSFATSIVFQVLRYLENCRVEQSVTKLCCQMLRSLLPVSRNVGIAIWNSWNHSGRMITPTHYMNWPRQITTLVA